MVFRLFRRSANRDLIDRLRGEIVAAARDPVLFTEYGIEDSLKAVRGARPAFGACPAPPQSYETAGAEMARISLTPYSAPSTAPCGNGDW